ncbi:DUF6265 family protein [Dyadobacter sp. LHD-138]|uniref:DUF6265 family protein n=1 Tax=Dyadobacter sp. LHD-138 TaxID=3071413 RepID=UPI0027E0A4CE|nr:DUF6265 family protein [Dyadobacter sp. LHD-138]MDQ6477800.1 DUF6265 family protein [Dyadobacter sp. LHD-138]
MISSHKFNFGKILSFVLLLSAILGASAHAQTTSKGSLKDINFLDGRWKGNYNGGTIEASWTAPEGDNIVGFIRMVKDGKATLYELFAFEQTEKGPVAHVKHFKPGMISLEEKDVSDTYNFIEAKKNEALFEKDDVSVRIIYERRSQNQLVIRRGKMENNKWEFIDLFVFNRIP